MANEIDPIIIDLISLGGYAPVYWKSDYPRYGNKNHAGRMENVDMKSPDSITQAPALAILTAGDEDGAITTLVKRIMQTAESLNVTYAVGGNKIQKLSSTAVTNTGSFPATIDKGGVTGEDAEDIIEYQSALYTFYNYTGGGDISKLTLPSTFDHDWGSTVPTGAEALANAVHQAVVAGTDGILAFTNGSKVGTYDGTTLTADAFDTHDTDSECVSMVWGKNSFYIASNKPNLTGNNKTVGKIYIWDGNQDSWDFAIPVGGRIGALYVMGGEIFVWYQKDISTSVVTIGVVSGTSVQDLRSYEGSLPSFGQITDDEGFILFMSGDDVMGYGAGEPTLPGRIFHYNTADYATGGALSSPFGTPLVASTATTHFKLSKMSGYRVDCSWKSMLFDLSGIFRKGMIDKVIVETEAIPEDGRVDINLVDSKGDDLIAEPLQFNTEGETRFEKKISAPAYNCRVEIDWSEGSDTNPTKIRKIILIPSIP